MGFFHKKLESGAEKALYSVGFNKTIVLVGLGNVGEKYAMTRHNLGFQCVDFFAASQEFPAWQEKKDLKCHFTKKLLGDTNVLLIKPITMMNLSGESVSLISNFFKVSASQFTVIHDDLDILFGQIRTRSGGGAAGHNGIKSIITHIGENFGRIRIGIGGEKPEQMETSDYVLATLSKNEQSELPNLKKECASILTEHIFGGNLLEETRSFLV